MDKVGMEGGGPSHPRSSNAPLTPKAGPRIPLEFPAEDRRMVEVLVVVKLLAKMEVVSLLELVAAVHGIFQAGRGAHLQAQPRLRGAEARETLRVQEPLVNVARIAAAAAAGVGHRIPISEGHAQT